MTWSVEERKTIVNCECGIDVTKACYAKHIRTERHKYRMSFISKGLEVPPKEERSSYYHPLYGWISN